MWTCLRCGEQIEDGFDACWQCGTDREGQIDPNFRHADEPEPRPAPSAGVSARCPACGSSEYRPIRPAGWVAYAPDRLCFGCGTRYTLPTPRWAALAFAGLGAVLLVLALVVLLARVGGSVFSILGAIGEALIGALGLAAMIHGIRALRHPGEI